MNITDEPDGLLTGQIIRLIVSEKVALIAPTKGIVTSTNISYTNIALAEKFVLLSKVIGSLPMVYQLGLVLSFGELVCWRLKIDCSLIP